MCGIVGFKTSRNFKSFCEDLPKAVSALSHRGPDDSGIFCYEQAGIGLGHRRLSILDLSSAGRQPMCSDDQRVWISYNGEIYNFKKIRQTLESLGHQIKSETDTEVVLKAYLQWGTDCLQYFQGMFAIAIWDGNHHQFFLARDRIGIKPLYYYYHNDTLLFSSELKALMFFRGFIKDIDPDAIPLYLHYQYIPTPRTIFKHTFKLQPGHFLIYKKGEPSVQAYWGLPKRETTKKDAVFDETKCLKQLDGLLHEVISDHLVSDVPLGALLSGGVDSSVVVAIMQKVNTSPTQTFCIGFGEETYNEAPWAARIAKYLHTDHTELYVTPKEALNVVSELPWIYDEPFADASAIPTYLVSKLTRSRVTVALSGDGGDEQFSGYVRYWTTAAMDNTFSWFPASLRKMAAYFLEALPIHVIEKYYQKWQHYLPRQWIVANFPDKWQKFMHVLDKTDIQEIYRTTICLWSREEILALCGKKPAESTFEMAFNETAGWPPLSKLMYVDQKTYLPDDMLTKVDRASMAASLEIRVPLLDHRVVEYSASLPDQLKYKNGTGKYVLKKLLAQYVPETLFERPKRGFGVPIDQWFRNELKPLLCDYLSPNRIKKEGMFDHKLVEEKIKDHLHGKANHQYPLWALLMWEMWREKWLG